MNANTDREVRCQNPKDWPYFCIPYRRRGEQDILTFKLAPMFKFIGGVHVEGYNCSIVQFSDALTSIGPLALTL